MCIKMCVNLCCSVMMSGISGIKGGLKQRSHKNNVSRAVSSKEKSCVKKKCNCVTGFIQACKRLKLCQVMGVLKCPK